jgi:integral membrane protein (TIGR01906 family)
MTALESAPGKPSRGYKTLSWLVTLITPVVLVLTAVRALLTPAFLPLEYNMPGFPEDAYGFTTEDRLYWSRFALDYLVNDAGIEYLGDLRFEDGSAAYNERELRHMVDVKVTVQAALRIWGILLGALAALGMWAWRGKWWVEFRHGLGRGGWLTLLIILGVIVVVLLSFGVFFVAFHNVFFEPGTWTFLYSDTLIRLFPERFWRDIFIYVGAISAALGLLLGWLCKPGKA